jgi:CBS domain-containing protein
MKVRDILQAKPGTLITIESTATLREASQYLKEHHIGVLLVLDGRGKPVGILSERDIVREFAFQGALCETAHVGATMTRDLITSTPDDDLMHVMNLMTDHRIRHLPVLDGGELVGLVSIGDVVKAVVNASVSEIEQLRSYITGVPS